MNKQKIHCSLKSFSRKFIPSTLLNLIAILLLQIFFSQLSHSSFLSINHKIPFYPITMKVHQSHFIQTTQLIIILNNKHLLIEK